MLHKTLGEIADILQGELVGDSSCIISGVGPIESAGKDQIAFAEKGKSLKKMAASEAGAVIVPPDVNEASKNLIRVGNPRLAFTQLMTLFHPLAMPPKGIHASAVIGDNCRLGENVVIAAGVVIGNDVTIGNRVVLHPNVVIGNKAAIGEDSIIYPLVSILEQCQIGRRVVIHSGSVIGSDGFGFVPDSKGHFIKIPQTGIVQIDDHVEIGANNTIDRATFGRTWIQEGVKTDNLVHIAHNVIIGKHTVIAGQAGFAGSTTVGSHVVVAGQAGVAGHIEIADGATIGPQAAIAQSVKTKQILSGTTVAMPHGTWLRLQRVLPDLPQMQKNLHKIEKRLKQLEDQLPD